MKFSQFNYERPNIDKVKEQFNNLLAKFEGANNFDEQKQALQDITALRRDFETQRVIASIRYSIDTTSKSYEEEQDFFDENVPQYGELISKYQKVLVNSKYKNELEKEFGKQVFTLAELDLKTFSPEIIGDLQEENKLSTEYTKLRASGKIMFDGKEYTLSQMVPFMLSPDRDLRKRANEAWFSFFEENEEQFDRIYDQLVKVRHRMAKKMGFNNYIEFRYAQMGRSDYGPKEVEILRKQIADFVVPVTESLRAKQKERLGVDKLKYYDDSLIFKTGNPQPKGEPAWILQTTGDMFEQVSPETNEFFKFMLENELLDVESKKGKAGGGYCDYMPNYKSPFIFSNFNGTADDIDTLTHECGHAFQAYSSRNFDMPEYVWPTLEAAEIHSMSMELITWPWMNMFFEDAQKYKFMHLSSDLFFLPYGTAVDEFQHFVFENPEATPKERKQQWRKIERKYLPYRDYEDNEYLENGGFWHKQGHIFGSPFYYIDYVLAQTCAFQFWQKANVNREETWKDYLRLCKAGGSKSFLELVKLANLQSPFEEGCIKSIAKDIEKWLSEVDQTKF